MFRGIESPFDTTTPMGRAAVMTQERIDAAIAMGENKKRIVHIAGALGVGKSSVARALAKSDAENAATESEVVARTRVRYRTTRQSAVGAGPS